MTETPQQDRVNTEHLRDYSQLRRSVSDRKVAGVAGGLGRHLNIDPTVLRVAFVVLCFFGGAGFVLYGAAWLFVPEDGKDEAPITTNANTRNAVLIGAVVVAGLLLVGDSWGGFGFPWPLLLIGVAALLYVVFRDRNALSPQPPAQYGPEQAVQYGPQPPAPPWMPPTQQPYQPPAPRPDRGPKLFWVTLALVAIALGALGLYDVAGHSVLDSAYPALALAIVGVMLVLGAWFGRPGGLIFLGIMAAVILALSQISNSLSAGHIDRAPGSAAQVQDVYRVGAGQIDLDLTRVHDLAALDGRTIEMSAGAGQINVVVPDGLDVNVHGEIGYGGEIRIGPDDRNGNHVVLDEQIDGGTDVPQLDINIDLKFGDINVRQS